MPKLTDIPHRKICNKETYSIFLFDVWFSILVCFLLFSESSFFFFHLRSVSGQRLPVDTISLRNIKFQLSLIQLWCDIQRLTRNKFISELNPDLLSATVSREYCSDYDMDVQALLQRIEGKQWCLQFNRSLSAAPPQTELPNSPQTQLKGRTINYNPNDLGDLASEF